MALLFGIVEFGFFFKDYLAAAGAVRAGVRIASANPRNSMFAQAAANQVALSGRAMNLYDVQQLWVYKVDPANPAANLPLGKANFANSCTSCVKFVWNGTNFSPLSSQPASEIWHADDQHACASSGPGGPPDRIGVYLELRHNAFTHLVFNTLTISEASIMSLEPMSYLTGCGPMP